jgi:hypothetical protein
LSLYGGAQIPVEKSVSINFLGLTGKGFTYLYSKLPYGNGRRAGGMERLWSDQVPGFDLESASQDDPWPWADGKHAW